MALTRITKGVIKPNENYDTHNINSTGIVTAIGLDVNGNGDISGSLNVGGVLTYEDVTSIDSVGIITARTGLVSPYADIDDYVSVGNNIHLGNAGVITATSFVGSGAALTGIDATAIKDSGGNVKIQAQASGAVYTGIHTFNSDLDVDGHTNLDNLSVVGVSTFTGNIIVDNGTVRCNDGFSSDVDLIFNADANNNGTGSIIFKESGSEKLRIGASGQIGIAGANYGSSGQVLTSGGASGSVSWSTVTGTTINNNADNRIITGSGTANTLNGEANLTFDGTNISVGTGATISSVGNVTAGIATFAGGVTFKGDNGTLHWRMKPSGVFEPAFNNFFSIGDTYYNVNNVFTKNLVLSEDIIHNLDTNTKIRFPAVDTISMETAGSERLRIASDGTVIFTNKLTNSSSYTTHNANFYGGNTNTGGVRIEVAHNNTTVSGNTAQGSFPHHLNLTNYSGSGSADNRMVTIGFDIPTTSTHANGAIAYQATGAGQGDFSFWTETGNAIYERLRINSSGQLIMTNAATQTFADFSTTNNTTRGLISLSGKDGSGNAVTVKIGGFGDTNRGEIFTDSNHGLGFATNNAATQMVLGTNGCLSIGKTGSAGKAIEIYQASFAALRIQNSSTGTGNNDGILLEASGSDCLLYNYESANLKLGTAGTERLRIQANGEVGINISDPDSYGANGHGYRGLTVQAPAGGYSGITIRSNYAGGGILAFSDGSGSNAELKNIALQADHVNRRLDIMVNGSSKVRFTENGFHPNPADTAAANALDDYEEGSWTPTAQLGASGITVYAARYTKVGNKVFIDFRGFLTGTNGNVVQIGGLPYANLASNAHNVGPVMHNGFDFPGSEEPYPVSYITGTNSYFQMYYSRTNSNGWTSVTGNDTGGDQFITSLTYFTS